MRFISFICCLALLVSCNSVYTLREAELRSVEVKMTRLDSGLYTLLKPYREGLNTKMDAIVAFSQQDMVKAQPEGNLGNFMADALMDAAVRVYGVQPDIAVMNYGGIRLPVLKKGAITTRKIYELFPFDNLLVLVSIRGEVLQQFLDHIAGRGGWPVAGMQMQIQNKKAVAVIIGNQPLEKERNYLVAMGDYTANGGDDASMLKGLPQQNKGYLMRDALLDYLKGLQAAGKALIIENENRVKNAE